MVLELVCSQLYVALDILSATWEFDSLLKQTTHTTDDHLKNRSDRAAGHIPDPE